MSNLSIGGERVYHWELLVINIRQKPQTCLKILLSHTFGKCIHLWHITSTPLPENACFVAHDFREVNGKDLSIPSSSGFVLFLYLSLCRNQHCEAIVRHRISGFKLFLIRFSCLTVLLHSFHPLLLHCYVFLHENQDKSYTSSEKGLNHFVFVLLLQLFLRTIHDEVQRFLSWINNYLFKSIFYFVSSSSLKHGCAITKKDNFS